MTTATALLERLAPGEPAGPRAERGRAWLEAHGLPRPKDEAWRYTPLEEVVDAFVAALPAPPGSVDPTVVDALAGDHGGPRLVAVNGRVVPAASHLGPVGSGLWIGGAEGLRGRARPASGATDEPADGFHALGWAAADDVAAVVAGPDTAVALPVHVVHVSRPGTGTGASHPHTVVRAGPGAHLEVIESFVGVHGGRAVTNASTRLVAAEGASITYTRIQAEPLDAVHVGRVGVEQAAGAALRLTAVTTGAAIARTGIDVLLAAPGTRADLVGLSTPSGHQRHDTVVTVDHAAPSGTSTQRFKAIVDDVARASFGGHVIVRPGAAGTDASQSNPNLLLAATAQADTRPWLEILADDVRCTHGATVGRLDDDALFYLRSRGIPAGEARAMLVAAFAAEVVDALTPASLRDHVAAALRAHLEGARP